jgi:hypothetical protein
MNRLIINKLIYNVTTHDGETYGAEVPFKPGLNIIYGPNSVGKTSIITGIIYGLGAEKGLGIFKTVQNPFKPEFYKSINSKQIKTSYLLLEISNGSEIRTIFRYIKGTDVNVAAIKKTSADNFFAIKEVERLIIGGEGVFSENGFQSYLYEFIGLPQVELPTYEQKLAKLYLENIIPLFFVEQRAGWSQIQARQVTRYNIKDIKKVAFEYLFGLDRFNLHLNEIRAKELESELKKLKDKLGQQEEAILVIANGENLDGVPIIKTNNRGKTSIYDYITYLKDKYLLESNSINELSTQNKTYEESNNKLRDKLKAADYQYRKLTEKLERINTEISGYESYLERIQINKYKNKQLKKIYEFSTDLNISTCPVCEAKLQSTNENECVLCHTNLTGKISTPDQNLTFLEDEENTFKKVIIQRILDRRKIIEQQNTVKDKIEELETQLEHQTITYAGKEFAQLRQTILDADSTFKEMEKYSRIAHRWENLDLLRKEIKVIDVKYETLKTEISAYEQTVSDNTTINTVKSFVQSNLNTLGLFKGNKELINDIKVDANDNYTPYLDNFDIYNISSSSDNIRIILSYYLSLLQTSIKLKALNKIIYPNILILDEPKQQNLDNDSLIDCLGVIGNISTQDSQVILTTYSELQSDRDKLLSHIIYEMKTKTDYLLKKIPNK